MAIIVTYPYLATLLTCRTLKSVHRQVSATNECVLLMQTAELAPRFSAAVFNTLLAALMTPLLMSGSSGVIWQCVTRRHKQQLNVQA